MSQRCQDGLLPCNLEGQNLDMSIGEIDPVMDGIAGENTDLDAAARGIAFMMVGVLIGRRTQIGKVTEQARPLLPGHGIEHGDHLQIDEQPILHKNGLLRIPLPQIIEFHPMRRVGIVDLSGQRALEIRVLLRLPPDEESNQLPLLGRLQMRSLVFELRQ